MNKTRINPVEDLALERLWVIYPGRREYPLSDKISVIPIESVPDMAREL
jgi:hypothetical protein